MNGSSAKKKLKIAQVAPLWFTIPPRAYGGIERIVSSLTEGLVARGHDVTLFAAPGSRTAAKLVSVFPKALSEENISWSNPIWNLRNLSLAAEQSRRGAFDLIHLHTDLWGLFFQGLTEVPVVHTMHNPLYRTNADATKDDRLRLYQEEAHRTNIVFISESAKRYAMVEFPLGTVIYNGINMEEYRFNAKGGDHFVWIARMNKHKGVENAIAASEKLGAKLMLAGRIDPTQKEYFDNVISPHLNDTIQYIGELTPAELSDFYGSAKALLYPIEWEEPFGLVVVEAMACGTPVIAYRRGSMEELIINGKNGFVVDSSLDQLTDAMKNVERIDRRNVRKHAEDHFSADRMVDAYEAYYFQLLEQSSPS